MPVGDDIRRCRIPFDEEGKDMCAERNQQCTNEYGKAH